jgi:Domain of unknown function (DUF4333)
MHTTHSRKKVVTTAVAAIAGLAALTSCQFSFSSGGPDYELLESAITDELNEIYPKKISHEASSVDCPRQADTPKSGDSFLCTADVDGHAVRVEVTVKNDDLELNTLDMVYDLAYTAQVLSAEISNEVDFAVTMSCGEGLKVVPIGDSFECTAADEFGDTRTIKVTANPEGEFWEVLE